MSRVREETLLIKVSFNNIYVPYMTTHIQHILNGIINLVEKSTCFGPTKFH